MATETDAVVTSTAALARIVREQRGIEQVDPVMAEDGRSVVLWGYGAGGQTFIASHEGTADAPADTERWKDLPIFRWRQVA